jgi:hypothetical protein
MVIINKIYFCFRLADHYVQKIMIEETTTTTTKTTRPAASSATRELDDLMASLSDFKVSTACFKHNLGPQAMPYTLPPSSLFMA